MDANPFERAQLIHSAIEKTRNWRTPTLAMVHSAYVADDLDYEDLERLIGAALKSEPTEIPEPMLSRFWPYGLSDVLKEAWTSPRMVVPVAVTDAPGAVMYYRPA